MNIIKSNPCGIYEKAMPDSLTVIEKIKLAKKAGFDFLELSVDESDVRLSRLKWSLEERMNVKMAMLEEAMPIYSLCLSAHRRFPFGSADAQVRARAYEIMSDAIGLAVDLGIRNIQLAGYDVYYEPSDVGTVARFVEGLKAAAAFAAKNCVMLSIEIMDTELIGTIGKGLAFMEAVDSPWLKIYPDLGNLSQWTDTPEIELEMGLKHIVGIHVKDTQPGKFKCVPFGEGTVRFSSLFRTLEALAYSGPFLIEMWWDNTRSATEETVISELIMAREWLYAQ